MASYIAIIHKDADSDYGVSFPDFPGCITAGSDLDEARRRAIEALSGHVELMAEDGDAIPEPASLETVMQDANNRDGVAVLVTIPDRPAKAIRLNITLPSDLLKEVDSYAEQHGLTRSGLLAQAVRKELARA